VAKLGPQALAAAALATTICNVTGMSLAVGLSFGLSTLTGQAKGDLMRRAGELKLQNNAKTSVKNEIGGRGISHPNIEDGIQSCSVTDNDLMINGTKTEHGIDMVQIEEKKETDPLLTTTMTNHSSYSSGGEIDLQTNNASTILEENNNLEDMPIQPLVFLYRGLFVQLLFVVPIGVWWMCGIEPLLLALGQGRKLSQMTADYLRILSPGLWCYSINFTFTAWLQSINMADVPAYAALSGFSLHIPFNLLFVNVLGYGYKGVAMATVMFQLLQPILICVYLFATDHGRGRMLEHTGAKGIGRTRLRMRNELRIALSSPSGILQYLVLALPGVVVITEWWASEVCIFLAGTLEPDSTYALGAMSIYQSINSFCFMFPIGFSSAASARVGMFLGRTDPRGAKLASFVSMTGAMVLSTIMGCVLMWTPHNFFPWLFTPDENVISATSATIPFLAVYVFADGMQITLNAILKGCGKQAIAMPIVIVSYWFVGVPLAYYNAFILNEGTSQCERSRFCGTAGLVAGMTIGTWTHFILLLIAVLVTINFRKEAVKAQERISLEKKILSSSKVPTSLY